MGSLNQASGSGSGCCAAELAGACWACAAGGAAHRHSAAMNGKKMLLRATAPPRLNWTIKNSIMGNWGLEVLPGECVLPLHRTPQRLFASEQLNCSRANPI